MRMEFGGGRERGTVEQRGHYRSGEGWLVVRYQVVL